MSRWVNGLSPQQRHRNTIVVLVRARVCVCVSARDVPDTQAAGEDDETVSKILFNIGRVQGQL